MLSPDPFLNPATVAAALVAVAALAWLLGRCYENTRMENERAAAERKAREERKIPAAKMPKLDEAIAVKNFTVFEKNMPPLHDKRTGRFVKREK